jgi:peptidylprolyl isomerase
MNRVYKIFSYVCFTFTIGLVTNVNASKLDNDWRTLDPANTLMINSSKGMIVIEMRPELASKSIERIKLLAREKVYDGLQFHRVIAGFVAQTGNPNNRDGGVSTHPNLAPEMMFSYRLKQGEIFASYMSDASAGFIGSVPFQSETLNEMMKNGNAPLRAWGAHCAGVVGMGRGEARDSANSEFYFMLKPARRLDKDYTVFGRVVLGFDVLKKLNVGEPPAQADVMTSVRVLEDIPLEERPVIQVLSGKSLVELIKKTRLHLFQQGADLSVCDITIPARTK